jgi:hypothetical protein
MQNPELGVTMKIAVYWCMATPDLMKVSTFLVNLFLFFRVGSGSSKSLGSEFISRGQKCYVH